MYFIKSQKALKSDLEIIQGSLVSVLRRETGICQIAVDLARRELHSVPDLVKANKNPIYASDACEGFLEIIIGFYGLG